MTAGTPLPVGYVDVPAGKLAAVHIALEMTALPNLRNEPSGDAWSLRHASDISVEEYRELFRLIGTDYLWSSRLCMEAGALEATIGSPDVEVYVLDANGENNGIAELDFRVPNECELALFGVSQPLLSKGAGRWLMNRALSRAWSRPIHRLWVHTCNLDHPRALAFYMRSGFRPFKRMVEIYDDPRLDGTLPSHVAPHQPAI